MMTPDQLSQFQHGLDLFNAGEFYDCHEVLEDLWNDLNGDEKRTVQGILQIAVGFYHLRTDNLSGARSLFRKALDKFEKYPTPHDFPLTINPLIDSIRSLHSILNETGHLTPELIKQVPPVLAIRA